MHQNRASPFASDYYCGREYRREFRSEDHFYPFSSQKKSRFASDFLCRGNRASWGLKKSRDFSGSGKNRRRNRRESRDFGALRPLVKRAIFLVRLRLWGWGPFLRENLTKGKIASALFHTFLQFSTLFHTFSHFFFQDFFLGFGGFTTVLAQSDEKRPKENKKEKTRPFCTLVVARLSSSGLFPSS